MNEEMQIKIINLMDDGAKLDNSPELKELVHSSEETRSFYESILVSESAIKDFFGGDKSKELSDKIDAYIEEQFNKPSKVLAINFKPFVGLAIAASMAAIGFVIFNSSLDISETKEIALKETQTLMIEEAEPLFISGEDMANGLWGPSSELAKQIGLDRYEIMYVVYEANKKNFINNDINQPKQDETFFVDLSLIENLDKSYVIDEVKRHIFCAC